MPRDIILCVDDDPTVLRAPSIAIAEAGCGPTVAENGLTGLDAFHRLKGEVCMVLADAVMPGMSGREMARRILAVEPGVKIAIMTGYGNEIPELEGSIQPAVLRKPFLMNDLVKKNARDSGGPGKPSGGEVMLCVAPDETERSGIRPSKQNANRAPITIGSSREMCSTRKARAAWPITKAIRYAEARKSRPRQMLLKRCANRRRAAS